MDAIVKKNHYLYIVQIIDAHYAEIQDDKIFIILLFVFEEIN